MGYLSSLITGKKEEGKVTEQVGEETAFMAVNRALMEDNQKARDAFLTESRETREEARETRDVFIKAMAEKDERFIKAVMSLSQSQRRDNDNSSERARLDCDWKGLTRDELYAKCKELGFHVKGEKRMLVARLTKAMEAAKSKPASVDYSGWTVPKLKAECRKFELAVPRTKPDLIRRLTKAMDPESYSVMEPKNLFA